MGPKDRPNGESVMKNVKIALPLLALVVPLKPVLAQPVADTHSVSVERVDTLPNHTLFRPVAADGEQHAWPLLVWENGGCSNDPTRYSEFLSRVASAGYLVAAQGYEGNETAAPEREERGREADMLMAEAIAWASIETARDDSEFYQQIDTNRVGLFGHSCGGFTSLQVAPTDPRVGSVIVFNSSTNPFWEPERSEVLLNSFPAGFPVAWVNGGPSDIAYPNGQANWVALPATMPGFHVEYDFPEFDSVGEPSNGHSGFFRGELAPRLNPAIADIAINWFDFTVADGSDEARDYLFGEPCGFCADENWQVQVRNWSEFSPPEGAGEAQ